MGTNHSTTTKFNAHGDNRIHRDPDAEIGHEMGEPKMTEPTSDDLRGDEAMDAAMRALADRHRRQIVRHLADHPSTTTELTVAADSGVWMTPYHLRILKSAGIVRSRRHHRNRVSYHLNLDILEPLRDYVLRLAPPKASDERPRLGAEAVVHRLPFPAWLLTPELRTVAVNEPLAHLLQTPMRCLLDRTPYDFADGAAGETLRTVLGQGGTREMAFVLQLPPDGRVAVRLTLSPLPTAQDALGGWLLMAWPEAAYSMNTSST
jgi:DNA-binding transcriptional ArsR family regulator